MIYPYAFYVAELLTANTAPAEDNRHHTACKQPVWPD